VNFTPVFTDQENYYSIGIDKDTGDHVCEVVITWIAWYSRYFRLTKDEIERFNADPKSLEGIARAFASSGAVTNYAERLILSENLEETELRDRILCAKETQNKPCEATGDNVSS
jgi:hypothetical protein